MKPTKENLREVAAPIIARWLITAAYERRVMTYGEAMEKLEKEEGFSNIGRATKLGYPAGVLMDHIWEMEDEAPLLNSLLVLQKDRMPSDGIAGYLAEWCDEPKFLNKGARKDYWELWQSSSSECIEEVYDFNGWEDLYERTFKQKYTPDTASKNRKSGRDGTENDGIPRGRGGEGNEHKALRLWVTQNSKKVAPHLREVRAETEVELLSGDRVDSVYYAESKTLAIEVKSAKSNEYDLQRGIYQCVKYQAVMRAMDARVTSHVEALLVTEERLSGRLRDLAKQLGVKYKCVSQDRSTIQ